jgi:hypothetical protein
MRSIDHRIFRTFEEFEREELRRVDSVASGTIEEEMKTLFGEAAPAEDGKRRAAWDAGEEE